jgi:hypothetical protein
LEEINPMKSSVEDHSTWVIPMIQIAIENGHRKFVDLPIKHGDFP